MPDENGVLNQKDVLVLDRFFALHNPDLSLPCPVTGNRIPIVNWKITNRLCLAPLMGAGLAVSNAHLAMLHMTSPAGGVVFIDAIKVGLVGVATLN